MLGWPPPEPANATLLQFPILHHIQSDCPPSFLSPLPSSRGVRRCISRENVNQSEHILVARSPWMTLCITENHKGTTSDKLSCSFYQAGLDSSRTKNISIKYLWLLRVSQRLYNMLLANLQNILPAVKKQVIYI